ncbi:MAG: DoxX family protein [Paramuribaculum sp.]|nr:DoxX family protein [Paramuribaculum sp.]
MRIIIGGIFIMSGLVKAIDLWGVVYKIEEYFSVWGVSAPRSLVEMLSLGLATAEFLLGLMLLVGAYRRTVVWGLLAMMAFMLPLTVYIYLYSPVSDCGCFGDFIHLSNGATLVKNILIVIPLIYLLRDNKRVTGLYHPYIQWIVGVIAACYVVFVGMYGLIVQPMVDFRSFPPGSMLSGDENQDMDAEPVFEFVYERNGHQKTFSMSELPDSTWTFVSRNLVSGAVMAENDLTELYITDDGEDVTDDVIATSGEQILITLPLYERADVSYTYIINELEDVMNDRNGSLIEIASVTGDELDEWRDLSMASYPIYFGESVMLKELARGVMAAVYIKDGRIIWKRTLGSINSSMLENPDEDGDILESFEPLGPQALGMLSIGGVALLFVVWLIGAVPSMQKHFNKKPKQI